MALFKVITITLWRHMIILTRNVRFMFFILQHYELLTSAKRSRLSFVFISMNAERVFNNCIKFYYILTKNKDYGKPWGQTSSPSYIFWWIYNNKQEFIIIRRYNNKQDTLCICHLVKSHKMNRGNKSASWNDKLDLEV